MPLYEVQAPNGRKYRVEGPAGASTEQLVAAVLELDPNAATPPKPVKQSSITGEAVRSVKQAASSVRTGIGSLFGEAPEAAAAGLERGQEIAEAAGEGPSFERIGRVFNEKGTLAAGRQVLSDLPRAVAGQAGTLASMYAGGKAGAIAGALTPVPGGALIGGGIGATAALLPQLFGSNIERQAAEQQEAGVPVDPNLARAGAAAAGQAALESVGTGFVLGKRVISGLLGISPVQLTTEAAKAKLVREAARTLAGGAARGAAVEIPVEIAQSVIERAQAGLDVTSEDAFKEYGEAAYLAGLVGGPLGSVGTGVSRGAARRELAAQEPPEPTEAPAPEVAPAPLSDMSIGQLYQEEARLSALLDAGRQPKEVVDRIKEVRELKKQFNIADAEDVILRREAKRVQAEQDQAFAAQSALSQPEQGEFRETALAPWEERELRQRAEEGQPQAPQPEAEAPRGEQLGLPGIAPPITREILAEAGLPLEPKTPQQRGVAEWFDKNVVGRTMEEIKELIEKTPDLIKGNALRARILREFDTVTPMPFEESAIGRPAATALPEPLGPELGGSEPSVELPSASGPVGGELGAAGAPATPVGAGVGAAELPAAQGTAPEGSEPLALTEPVPAAQALAPFLAPERVTPQAERALEPYVALMNANNAPPDAFPRYLGYDVWNGSTFDRQSGEIKRFGFKPSAEFGISRAQASEAFDALTPEAQAQVVEAAQEIYREAQRAAAARTQQIKAEERTRAETPTLDVDSLDLTDAEKEALAEYGMDRRPRVTETPTGRRVEGTRYQRAARPQTETEAFRRWFGDSKVVDKNGDPLVVYHGTRGNFDTFDIGKYGKTDGGWYGRGFYFAPSAKDASMYASVQGTDGANVMPVFLSIKNPYRVDTSGGIAIGAMRDQFRKQFGQKAFDAVAGTEGNTNTRFSQNVSDWLSTRGYDGVIVTRDGVTREYVAFRPEQIKSALGNVGTFDPTNPDIRYQEAPLGVPLSPEVLNELNTNGVADALNLLATTTDNPLYAALARRLSRLLGNTKVNIVDDLRNTEGKPAAGAASTSGRDIWLDRVRGLNEETFLHESVHAASEMVLATPAGKRTAVQNVAVKELNSLWDAAKADPDIKLGTDARESLSEFVTEALTNPKLIKDLKAKPWTLGSVWDQFKRTLLKMLGVKVPANMQEAAVAAMDTIFEPPSLRRDAQGRMVFQLSPAAETALKALRTGATTPLATQAKDQIRRATKIRTQLADKAATILDKVNLAVERGMMTALEGRAFAEVYKQAEAKEQFLPDFYRLGGMDLTQYGTWQVVQGKAVPVEAIELVKKWGESNGKSFDVAWADAGRLMESARQYKMREYNANARPGEKKLPTTKNFPIDTLYAEYLNQPELLRAKDILDTVRKDLIENMVSVGRISRATANEWTAVAEYIPFDRKTFDEIDVKIRPQKVTGRGLSAVGRLPEFVDAAVIERPVGNALENYFDVLGWMVQQTVQTNALNKSLKDLERIGEATYLGKTKDRAKNKTLVVHAFKNGEEVFYEVPTQFHHYAFNSAVKPLPKFIEILGKMSRALRTSITAVPTFPLTQLPMDIQRAVLTSGVKNSGQLTKKILQNYAAFSKLAMQGRLQTASKDLTRAAVVGDVDFRANEPTKSLLQELGYADRKTLGSKKLGTLLHRLNEFSRAGDVAVRQAIYDQTIAETNDKLLALRRAREIINFRTSGSGDPLGVTHFMLQTIPFFGAYIQGTDVLYRWIASDTPSSMLEKKAAKQQFVKMAGTIAAGSMAYALLMSGDDEYENTVLEERDSTWIIGGGLGLPVPTEIGIFFKAIPERVVEYFRNQGTPKEQLAMDAITSWMRAAFFEYFGRLAPLPAGTKPVLEAWTGYSFRTGRPLEGMFQKGLDAAYKATDRTSEAAKAVAQTPLALEISKFTKAVFGVEVSPIIIDNTLNGYFGTTAAMTLMATDALLNPDKADRPLHQFAGLGRFTYDPVGIRPQSEFYDLREKVASAQSTLNMLAQRDVKAALEYAEKNKDRLLAYKAVNATLEQLEKTRKYKQYLDTGVAAEEMSGEERLKKKQEVQRIEQGLVSWVRDLRRQLDL